MAEQVAGDIYFKLDGQLLEIKRQLRQSTGYPFDLEQLSGALHRISRGDFGQKKMPAQKEEGTTSEAPKMPLPDFSKTAPDFASWLRACEELHEFRTGEKVNLKEMFDIDEATLQRTDIMPIFRSAGASNRDAVKWKKMIKVKAPYEERNVMDYTGAKGPQIPMLGFIQRSVRPDENTLGENTKPPRDLAKIKHKDNQAWIDLFGYSVADDLHFMIKGDHLDPETWTWFVNDRLPPGAPGGGVARGCWYSGGGQSDFFWNDPDYCRPGVGSRLVTFFKLKS